MDQTSTSRRTADDVTVTRGVRSQLYDLARAIADHVDLLKRQIRSDCTPTLGQVEELFDLAERIDMELALNEPTLPCSIPACSRPAVAHIGTRPYCVRCAKALRAVTVQVQSDAPDIARTRLEAMVQGKTPWPQPDTAAERLAEVLRVHAPIDRMVKDFESR